MPATEMADGMFDGLVGSELVTGELSGALPGEFEGCRWLVKRRGCEARHYCDIEERKQLQLGRRTKKRVDWPAANER